MPAIHKALVVPYQPAQMYDLVDDIDRYSEFLPWCASSQVLKRSDEEVSGELVLQHSGMKKKFTTLNRLQKDKMIEIRLIDGPFKHLEGF